MLHTAKTVKGTILNVWVDFDSYSTTRKFCSIVAHAKDNPGLPLDWMRLGEINREQFARLVESGTPISL